MSEKAIDEQWPKITTDNEYKEWSRSRFYEIETLEQRGEPMDEFYRHAPAFWTSRTVFWFSLIAMLVLFGLSYYLGSSVCKTIVWWSNVCQNLAVGFVASLVLMVYANLKDRTSAYYSELVRVLKRKIDVLRTALNDFNSPCMDVAVLNGKYLECVYMSHQAEQFCYVVVGFMKYLHERIPCFKARMNNMICCFEGRRDKVCDVARKMQEEWRKSGVIERALAMACENAVFDFSHSIYGLEAYTAAIEREVFKLKFGKRKTFEHDPAEE